MANPVGAFFAKAISSCTSNNNSAFDIEDRPSPQHSTGLLGRMRDGLKECIGRRNAVPDMPSPRTSFDSRVGDGERFDRRSSTSSDASAHTVHSFVPGSRDASLLLPAQDADDGERTFGPWFDVSRPEVEVDTSVRRRAAIAGHAAVGTNSFATLPSEVIERIGSHATPRTLRNLEATDHHMYNTLHYQAEEARIIDGVKTTRDARELYLLVGQPGGTFKNDRTNGIADLRLNAQERVLCDVLQRIRGLELHKDNIPTLIDHVNRVIDALPDTHPAPKVLRSAYGASSLASIGAMLPRMQEIQAPDLRMVALDKLASNFLNCWESRSTAGKALAAQLVEAYSRETLDDQGRETMERLTART